MPGSFSRGIESLMTACIFTDTPLLMAIDGIAWSWQSLGAAELPALLPLVMAADPSGAEALNWPGNAVAWLAEQPCQRGLVGVQCPAGLTLALFFYALCEEKSGVRRLVAKRLRWLELARPHRSLDAVLTILADTSRRLDCADILIDAQAATERHAREALGARAEVAGFAFRPQGWHRQAPH
jgi:hypothetical protein